MHKFYIENVSLRRVEKYPLYVTHYMLYVIRYRKYVFWEGGKARIITNSCVVGGIKIYIIRYIRYMLCVIC